MPPHNQQSQQAGEYVVWGLEFLIQFSVEGLFAILEGLASL